MQIDFNQVMHSDFNFSLLNSSNIDIWVAPFNNWHEQQESFIEDTLNLTWEVVQFNVSKMFVQLKFNKPAEISPDINSYDSIVVNFLTNDTFVSRNNGTLHHSSKRLQHKIPKQMANSKFN